MDLEGRKSGKGRKRRFHNHLTMRVHLQRLNPLPWLKLDGMTSIVGLRWDLEERESGGRE